MARPCSVCGDKRRSGIDQAIATGESLRRIAARFQLPATNLRRHAPHAQATIQAAQEMAETGRVLDVAKILSAINTVCLEVMSQARGHDPRLVLMAANTVGKQLEFSHALESAAEQREILVRIEALEQALVNASTQPVRNGAWHSAV